MKEGRTISKLLPDPAAAAAAAKSLQLCPTLCDPIDGSPPGSPVPGILQARTLEWGIIQKEQPSLPRKKFTTNQNHTGTYAHVQAHGFGM